MEKSLLWWLFKMDILLSLESLSFYLEHQKTIFLGLFWSKAKKDQISFFNLNHGLTPLEKSLVWYLCKMAIFSLESLIFYLEHQQTIFLGLFWPKTKKDQISIFQCKPRVSRSEKSLIWQFCNNYGHSSGLESLCFYLEHQQTIFLGLFCPLLTKNKCRSHLKFSTWTTVNPRAIMGQRGFLRRRPGYVNFTKVCLEVVITWKSKL